jgi:hypothetical protein
MAHGSGTAGNQIVVCIKARIVAEERSAGGYQLRKP